MGKSFLENLHHSFLGVLAAVLRLLGALPTEAGSFTAMGMAALLDEDIDHSFPSVLSAKLLLLGTQLAKSGLCAAKRVTALLAIDDDHSRWGVLAAMLPLRGAIDAKRRHNGAAWVRAQLAGLDMYYSLSGMILAEIRLLGTLDAVRQRRAAAEAATPFHLHHVALGVLAAEPRRRGSVSGVRRACLTAWVHASRVD